MPLLGIYLEKIIIQKDTRTPLFTAALYTIAKTSKQPQCPPTDGWTGCGAYTQGDTTRPQKRTKQWRLQQHNATIVLNEVSQKGKDKHHMNSLIHGFKIRCK